MGSCIQPESDNHPRDELGFVRGRRTEEDKEISICQFWWDTEETTSASVQLHQRLPGTTECLTRVHSLIVIAITLMVVTHSQETCTSRLVQETWPSDIISCTRFFLYKFLATNTAELYSIQETCVHVTRMVSSDWSAAYRCHVFILLCWRCWQFVVQS